MLRRCLPSLWLAACLLTACQPVATLPPAATVPSPAPPIATSIPYADAIQFALIGETHLTNVWAYYDEPGAAYNNRAVQAEFWPSLFRISPVTGAFEPYLAGTHSPLEPDSGFLASTVTLRANLFWSDGSPLTAEDVAFTVNSALKFNLGFDWSAAYNADILDHAAALSPQTVRFYFRTQPSIEQWQYGALQGAVVQAAFWRPKLMEAESLLAPNPNIDQDILALQNERALLELELKDLLAQLALFDSSSSDFADVNTRIYARQDEINGLDIRIENKRAEKESAFAAARQKLYGLSAQGEPTFGPFTASRRGADEFENIINPFFPLTPPNFERAVYRVYPDEESATRALFAGEINVVLDEDGVTPPREGEVGVAPQKIAFAKSNLRVIAFNLNRPFMADVNLRRAIACMGDGRMISSVHYPDGLILSASQFGVESEAFFPCAGMPVSERIAESVKIMKEAGYSWDVEPGWDGAARRGSGLKRGGESFPPITLLVAEQDPLRVHEATLVVDWLNVLGLNAGLEGMDATDVFFRVYESGDFDMAILGWRLARLPSYLCEWFGGFNPFGYARAELTQHCDAFTSALDLDVARREAVVIESLLAQDLPLAPLYSEVGYDLYAGVTYPFSNVLEGVTGMYGAPWLAIPVLR
ncbi:MAG: hypothetical protein HFACDABA_00785 [Anaerolineales bacterium]|nr:hypothetical protein [Anaerolineales bacterium]